MHGISHEYSPMMPISLFLWFLQSRHQPICAKSQSKRRKVFDSTKQRLDGTGAKAQRGRPKPGHAPPVSALWCFSFESYLLSASFTLHLQSISVILTYEEPDSFVPWSPGCSKILLAEFPYYLSHFGKSLCKFFSERWWRTCWDVSWSELLKIHERKS